MLPGLPQCFLVSIERYEFVQRTVTSAGTYPQWAEALARCPAPSATGQCIGGLVRGQPSRRGFVHEQAAGRQAAASRPSRPSGRGWREARKAERGQNTPTRRPASATRADQGRAERPAGPAQPAQDRQRRRARRAPGRGRQQSPPPPGAGTQQAGYRRHPRGSSGRVASGAPPPRATITSPGSARTRIRPVAVPGSSAPSRRCGEPASLARTRAHPSGSPRSLATEVAGADHDGGRMVQVKSSLPAIYGDHPGSGELNLGDIRARAAVRHPRARCPGRRGHHECAAAARAFWLEPSGSGSLTCTRNSTPHRPAGPAACPSCICANCSAPWPTSAPRPPAPSSASAASSRPSANTTPGFGRGPRPSLSVLSREASPR